MGCEAVKALRQKRRLSPIHSLHEALHDHLRRIIRRIIGGLVFSNSQGKVHRLHGASSAGRHYLKQWRFFRQPTGVYMRLGTSGTAPG